MRVALVDQRLHREVAAAQPAEPLVALGAVDGLVVQVRPLRADHRLVQLLDKRVAAAEERVAPDVRARQRAEDLVLRRRPPEGPPLDLHVAEAMEGQRRRPAVLALLRDVDVARLRRAHRVEVGRSVVLEDLGARQHETHALRHVRERQLLDPRAVRPEVEHPGSGRRTRGRDVALDRELADEGAERRRDDDIVRLHMDGQPVARLAAFKARVVDAAVVDSRLPDGRRPRTPLAPVGQDRLPRAVGVFEVELRGDVGDALRHRPVVVALRVHPAEREVEVQPVLARPQEARHLARIELGANRLLRVRRQEEPVGRRVAPVDAHEIRAHARRDERGARQALAHVERLADVRDAVAPELARLAGNALRRPGPLRGKFRRRGRRSRPGGRAHRAERPHARTPSFHAVLHVRQYSTRPSAPSTSTKGEEVRARANML